MQRINQIKQSETTVVQEAKGKRAEVNINPVDKIAFFEKAVKFRDEEPMVEVREDKCHCVIL